MPITFKRIVKSGIKGFFRNSGLSTATIFFMVIVGFLISMLFVFNVSSWILISSIEEKVDISVYFNEDAQTENVLEAKSEIAKIPEVKEVEYISKEQILDNFIERHKDDPIMMGSLDEVGKNPFLDSLTVKTWQASQYNAVANFLENSDFKNYINKVDYFQRKPVIEKIFSITNAINRTGIIIGLILALAAMFVVYQAIRIAISNSSEEISVMKLVGASNWFVRGPYVVQGIIAGFLASLISFFLVFMTCFGLDSKLKAVAPEVSLASLFIHNFWLIILIQLAICIGLGVISSAAAVRKYLKI